MTAQDRNLLTVVILVAVSVAGSLGALRAQVPSYDLVIKNAHLVDGTGSPWFRADIGVRSDTIATIARHIDTPSARTVDAATMQIGRPANGSRVPTVQETCGCDR